MFFSATFQCLYLQKLILIQVEDVKIYEYHIFYRENNGKRMFTLLCNDSIKNDYSQTASEKLE